MTACKMGLNIRSSHLFVESQIGDLVVLQRARKIRRWRMKLTLIVLSSFMFVCSSYYQALESNNSCIFWLSVSFMCIEVGLMKIYFLKKLFSLFLIIAFFFFQSLPTRSGLFPLKTYCWPAEVFRLYLESDVAAKLI